MLEIGFIFAGLILLTAISVIVLSTLRGRQRLAEISALSTQKGEADREIASLSDENAGLKNQVTKLEGRIATLEEIVTDPAERTARQIEALR